MSQFGLKEHQIASIHQCFKNFEGIVEVIIYGSRAKGDFRNGSDIDLSIIDDGRLTFRDLLQIQVQLDELMLPWKMDISLLKQIDNDELVDHIERVGKVFYRRSRSVDISSAENV